MIKHQIVRALYKSILKPVAFGLDAEFVHNQITSLGESLENLGPLLSSILAHKNSSLKKNVLGIKFDNPIGLAAGFDYDGHMAKVLRDVGFGFNTVGTVTSRPCKGNESPRLARLPKSKSLLVNKGFKSEGAEAVAKRLDEKNLKGRVIGISIGSVNAAIDDYLFSLNVFKDKKYVSYFEINISCPNIALGETFANPDKFKALLEAVNSLKIKQPIFIKMPNEIGFDKSDNLVRQALDLGINGFIFSNLVKDRNNPGFDKNEIGKLKGIGGNFSGKPTFEGSNKLIAHTREKFGKKVVIIGSGGIFSTKDAKEKIEAGADLVQLITGMIFEGPQLIGEICDNL